MAEEYQQTIATAQSDGKVVGVDVVDLKGKEDDQKFHDEIIGYEKVDVEDVQAMTKVGEGEKFGCDTSSDSKSSSDSGSDSKSDSVSSKSNSISSKSNSDSDSKFVSNSGTSTLKEKKRIKRRAQKAKLSKELAEITEMNVNKDGAEGTKLLEEGDDKLHDKLQCDSSGSGSKSGSDSNSKTGSDSGSKSGSDSGSKSGSSMINAKEKRSIRKELKEKIKEKTSIKIVNEDKKNDLLISLEANKHDDKDNKMVEEGDENKQQSMLECDNSNSGTKSGSDSDSGSKSGFDSASKSGSITLKEKVRCKKIRRKGLKENIKKLNGMRGEENKRGLVAALEFNEDMTQEVGEGAMDKKINLLNKPLSDSSNSGFKSESDIGLGVDMTVIVEKLEEPMKREVSLEEKNSFFEKLKEKLPSYHKNPIEEGGAIERDVEGVVQGIKEKGILEKILGKLHVYHKNNEDQREKFVDAN